MRTIARPLITWDLNKQAEIRQLLSGGEPSDLRCPAVPVRVGVR